MNIRQTQTDKGTLYTLSPESIPSGAETVDFLADFARVNAGTDGYYIVPMGTGCFMTRFLPGREEEQELGSLIMPIYGMTDGKQGFVAIVTGMTYDFMLVTGVRNGVYYQFPRFYLYGQPAYEEISVLVIPLSGEDASYSGMARAYRQHQLERGACLPLREKAANRDVLRYAAAAPEIRIRMGWKPVPPTVLEQTPDTEPPMHVACTFKQARELIRACKLMGVEKAQFCLVGWNIRGHDGRWPQIFPVDEALGGEAELRATIKEAQALGYQIVCHTNSSDAYTIADCWDEEYIIKERDGTLSVNRTGWSGGRMYNTCPKRSYERFAQTDLNEVAKLGFHGLHYIDVLSVVRPRRCWDERHPLNGKQSVAYLNRMLAQAAASFGGISSEGAYDFACGVLDYGLYVAFNILGKPHPLADETIPLWQLVYHGITLSNPSAETINYYVKDARSHLKAIEYGARPSMYVNSRFKSDGTSWMGDIDLTCATQDDLNATARCIKNTVDEFEPMKDLQYAFMDDHRAIADGVYQVRYSDGTVLIADYNRNVYSINGAEYSVLQH